MVKRIPLARSVSGGGLVLLIGVLQLVGSNGEAGGRPEIFHNQFAVHIEHPMAHERADALASRHGFVNLGQIGSLEGHYLFEHSRLRKRSTESSSEHHGLLSQEPDVRWVEQQRELRRVKRDLQYVDLGEDAADENDDGENFPMPDPMWRYQWFLNHGAHDGSDMGVQPAWKMGYTGKGVVVTILDDGIQTNHPDLKLNYDPLASKDINSHDDDPMPRDNGDNKHGTRCAGEVAAEAFNHVCGVGVAFNASIGGVRMLDGIVNDAVEAKALSLRPQHIDIYSASWGPEDDGKTVDGPGSLAKKAFIDGVKSGRKGKGSIFVWASGNGGRKVDNCNCDGYTNSIFTLSISSASQGGRKPWYLEECSSTLATTYSSGTPSQDDSITTVDQDARLRPDKICTSYHTGTSASAPIAAGVCALALEANPSLTWRDMQHLVVLTSNPLPLSQESGWQTNGVNRRYSHKFGYGLMDAKEMVKLAKAWPGVGKQHQCNTKLQRVNAPIPDNSEQVVRVHTVTSACLGSKSYVRYLEHVVCSISLQYSPRGALHIVLTSPRGTRSSLLLPRPRDRSGSDFDNWPFLSVHFWGENPEGNWTLEVYRSPKGAQSEILSSRGILKEWKLTFYGTRESPFDGSMQDMQELELDAAAEDEDFLLADNSIVEEESINIISHAEANANLNNTLIAEHSEVGHDGCNLQCEPGAGCSGPGPHQCHRCRNFSIGSICVNLCHLSTFATLNRECYRCSHKCHSCFGPAANQCLSCPEDRLLLTNKSLCVEKCPWGYMLETSQKRCLPCPENCESCIQVEDSSQVVCTSCRKNLVMSADQVHCLDNCPLGYFENSQTRRCEPCNQNCSTCIGPLPTQCARCLPGTFYFQRKCVAKCPAFHTEDVHNAECVPCPNGCTTCAQQESGATQCTECQAHWKQDLLTGDCYPEVNEQCPLAPVAQFADAQNECRECHVSCATCSGGTDNDCLSCKDGQPLHIASCVDLCPHMTYTAWEKSGSHCRHCPHACEDCTSGKNCTKCHAGYVLNRQGQCVANCANREFRDAKGDHCKTCHPSCQACHGPNKTDCLACEPGKYFHEGKCVSSCPTGTFENVTLCMPCHSSCKTCSGPTHLHCTDCSAGLKLGQNHSCLGCPPGFYFHPELNKCRKCDSLCLSCSGSMANECLSCVRPLAYDPWNHACTTCCAGLEEKDCCECSEDKTKCRTTVRGFPYSKKRSFQEDGMASSRSFFMLSLVVMAGCGMTCMLWRLYGKKIRLRLRGYRPHAAALANGTKSRENGRWKRRHNGEYTKLPLLGVNSSDADKEAAITQRFADSDFLSDQDEDDDVTR